MRRIVKPFWFEKQWNSLRNVEQQPLMLIDGKIHINVRNQPKLAIRFFEALEQKLREKKVKATHFNELSPNQNDKVELRVYNIQDKMYYMKCKRYRSRNLVQDIIFEISKEEFEENRCLLHCLTHLQEQGRKYQLV